MQKIKIVYSKDISFCVIKVRPGVSPNLGPDTVPVQ